MCKDISCHWSHKTKPLDWINTGDLIACWCNFYGKKNACPFTLGLLGVGQSSWSAAAQLKSEARIRPCRHPVVFFFQVDLERSQVPGGIIPHGIFRSTNGRRPAASGFLCGKPKQQEGRPTWHRPLSYSVSMTFVEETARDVFFFSDGKSNARTKANKIFVQLQPITGRISLVYISLKSTLNLHPGPTVCNANTQWRHGMMNWWWAFFGIANFYCRLLFKKKKSVKERTKGKRNFEIIRLNTGNDYK